MRTRSRVDRGGGVVHERIEGNSMTENEKLAGKIEPRNPFPDVDPLRELLRRPGHFSRLMQDPWSGAGALAQWAPAMDVAETKDGYRVTVELAGAKAEDVSVECHDKMLTVKGEKRDEHEEQDEHRHYRERSYGSFSRSVRLPADAAEDVKASFKDGLLQIDIPKVEEKKPRVVPIDT